MTKPVDEEEMLLRIKALLRRAKITKLRFLWNCPVKIILAF